MRRFPDPPCAALALPVFDIPAERYYVIISDPACMSKPSLFVRFAPIVALWMFPCQVPAQPPASTLIADGPGIVVEPGAKVLERPPVFFPPGATMNGSVTVRSTVGAKGEVIDARVVRGPEQFRRAALLSVLNWRFEADGVRTVRSTIRFAAVSSRENGCLNGVWAQDQPSDWRWRFQALGDHGWICFRKLYASGKSMVGASSLGERGNLEWRG